MNSECEVSKPAILGAPYESENQVSQEELENEFFHADPVAQVGALILGFERHLQTLEDNLAKLFKQIGHQDEWNRILNS